MRPGLHRSVSWPPARPGVCRSSCWNRARLGVPAARRGGPCGGKGGLCRPGSGGGRRFSRSGAPTIPSAAGNSRPWERAGSSCGRPHAEALVRGMLHDRHLPKRPQPARSAWISLGLLLLMAAALAYRLEASPWLGDAGRVLALLWASAVYGLGLAVPAFRPGPAWAINLATGLGSIALVMARVPPRLGYLLTRPASDILWMMNVRLVTLFELLGQEVERVRTGIFPTEILMAPLFAVAVWGGPASRNW